MLQQLARQSLPLGLLAAIYLPTAAAVLLVTWLFTTLVDRRPFETIGYERRGSWAAELLLGLALGAGLPVLVFLIMHTLGWTKITGSFLTQPSSKVIPTTIQAFILMASVAVTEETVMRGYLLQTIRLRYGTVVALAVTSLLFGLAHLGNPGARATAFVGTALAGLMLGYAYLSTRRLWLPIAIHFAWNFTLGPVLGFPVSGIDLAGWVQQHVTGPPAWTGGAFGPEAGILGAAVWLIGIPIIVLFARYAHKA